FVNPDVSYGHLQSGDYQSPSTTKEAKKDASQGLLQIFWKPSTCKEIFNIGHSFHVNFDHKYNQVSKRGI
uniref:Uncharacterized protein n=1 Tax=Meleagris gallopavo TaxID=9103 RepID=G1NGR6_MELGA